MLDWLSKGLFSLKRNDFAQYEMSLVGGEFNHPVPIKVSVCHPADIPLPSFEKLKHCHSLL